MLKQPSGKSVSFSTTAAPLLLSPTHNSTCEGLRTVVQEPTRPTNTTSAHRDGMHSLCDDNRRSEGRHRRVSTQGCRGSNVNAVRGSVEEVKATKGSSQQQAQRKGRTPQDTRRKGHKREGNDVSTVQTVESSRFDTRKAIMEARKK